MPTTTKPRAIDSILMELEQEIPATQRLLERLPADKLDWRPHPKSWTLGQLALHVATVPASVAAMTLETVFEIGDRMAQGQPGSTREIMEAFTKGCADARKSYDSLDDAKAFGEWTATMKGKTVMTAPRIGVARMIGLNHWYHHRGQLTVYLRMLNVPLPSVYGPTADENPFA